MVAFPPCKINLGLHVLRRRPDGYHDIETCFYPVPRTDILEIVPSGQFKFVQTGIEIPGLPSDNICVRAYNLLNGDYNIGPAEIYLHKLIPPGSGLGAGSSDAACTLLLLNKMYNLSVPQSTLAAYAAKLGSDCPFFLYEKPMIGTGRGDQLSGAEVSLKGKLLIIVRPDIHISTAEAYQSVRPETKAPGIRHIIKTLPLEEWRGHLTNDFEDHALKKYPQIQQIRDELYRLGAVYASMSGSGSAVFGIFDSDVSPSNALKGMDYWSGWLEA